MSENTNKVRAAITALLSERKIGEMDGPLYAFFESHDQNKYTYQTMSLGADTADLLIHGMTQAFHLVPDGTKIVWRRRPEIEFCPEGRAEDGSVIPAHWAGYARYISIPTEAIPLFALERA